MTDANSRLSMLFELGTEELPPRSLQRLSDALQEGVTLGLEKSGLQFGRVFAYATPRRLALLIDDLQTAQPDQTIERRGPALAAAFLPDGSPTPATMGFARSCGVSIEALNTLETDKGAWLSVKQEIKGAATSRLLPDILSAALQTLPIAKRMRWGTGTAEFVRPVQWLLLLLGDDVVACELLGARADRFSYGHRFHAPAPIRMATPHDYVAGLNAAYVIADFADRKARIRQMAIEAAATVQGYAQIDDELLNEITALVEWPVAVLGSFDPNYLALPAEALITSMQENQKYFPVIDENGALLPHFITLSNIQSHAIASVRAGNERVIRPRLADAEFFWKQDRRKTLESRIPALSHITFQKTLGSVLQKSQRVALLAQHIATTLGRDPLLAERAAQLAKTDLLTEMVGEFTNLQGVMGRYYALAENEPDEIAWAIEEQYLPKVSGGQLPAHAIGEVLAIAEKLDTLCGIFSAGLIPSGDKDPYALRRAAIGLLRILIEKRLDLNLSELITQGLAPFTHSFDKAATASTLYAFIQERLRGYAIDAGFRPDEFEAVSALSPPSPLDFFERLSAVRAFSLLEESSSLSAANKRIRNVLRKAEIQVAAHAEASLMSEAAERALYGAAREAHADIMPLLDKSDYTQALKRLAALRPVVDNFFDQVMVMSDNPEIRNNRLGLLAILDSLFMNIADISSLQAQE